MGKQNHQILIGGVSLIKRLTFLSSFIILLCSWTYCTGQTDSIRLDKLIKETNERYLYLIANAIYLSPYELKHEHLDQLCKNIKYVDSINTTIIHNDKSTFSSLVVINNKTLILKPSERREAYTYMYHKDGKIQKKLRGRSLNDFFLYDDAGYLIQHGNGGETKQAKRIDNKFEWYNVKRNRLEYVSEFNEKDQIKSFKTMGHHFGPGVEYEMENYTFEKDQLVRFLKWMIYKGENPRIDTTETIIRYDSLGLINGIGNRSSHDRDIRIRAIESKVEVNDQNHITISISSNDFVEYSITYDPLDNWIEEVRPIRSTRTISRTIHYRKRRRWK